MSYINATKARSELYGLIDAVREKHEPYTIASKRGNVVMVAEEDWRAIQETLFLLSIPKMRESIRKGLETPVDECAEEPGW